MQQGADRVVQGNPAQVLRSRTHGTAKTEFEGKQHPGERALPAAHDEAKPGVDHADTLVARGMRGVLPLAADFREKGLAAGLILVEPAIAAIAVESRCRSDHPRFGRRFKFEEGPGKQACGADAALDDLALLPLGPPAGTDVFAGQVNGRVEPLDLSPFEVWRGGVPEDFVSGRTPFLPDELRDVVAALPECFAQSRANEPGRATDENSHDRGLHPRSRCVSPRREESRKQPRALL